MEGNKKQQLVRGFFFIKIKIIFLQELYTWDRGNQLTYPIRYHVSDFNVTITDKTEDSLNPQMQTGYDIFHDHDNSNDGGN